MRITLKQARAQSGFTLIEMSIVIIILGLGIASAAHLYKQWIKWDRAENTRLAVQDAVDAITAFRNTHGRYPCPAPLTATRNTMQVGSGPAASYGVETDCTVTTGNYALGVGVTNAGIARVNSTRAAQTYTNVDTGVGLNQVPRVRIGALPFRTLNIDEKDAYDGYNNRLMYAVTEQLTNNQIFNADGGGIGILNDAGTDPNNINHSIISPPNSSHFIIFSAGEDGAGAYNREGTRIACAAGSLQSENCDYTANSAFKLAQQGTSGTASQFDDTLAYVTHKDVPVWELTGTNDITTKTTGGVGIGPNASANPNEDLQVEGTLRAQDDPSTPAIEGQLQAAKICDYTSGSNTCFTSNLIAGDLEAGTGGMKCPAGQYMIGIKNNAPVCQTEIKVQCPSGQTMVGLNTNGTLKCSAPPPGSCKTESRTVCGQTKTLFAAAHNAAQDLIFGVCRLVHYWCNNGGWQEVYQNGACSPAETQRTVTQNCGSSVWGCGVRFTGSRVIKENYNCSTGNWDYASTVSGSCTCTNSTQNGADSCPAGFNDGNRPWTSTHNCAATPPSCGAKVYGTSTCKCKTQTETQNLGCPAGYSGEKKQTRNFVCPGGQNNPGSWTGWTVTTNTCSCSNHSYDVTNEACPTGYQGSVHARYTKTCPNANYVRSQVSSNCTPIPPTVCRWKIENGGVGGIPFANPINDGQTCACGSAKRSCSTPQGGGKHRWSQCNCSSGS